MTRQTIKQTILHAALGLGILAGAQIAGAPAAEAAVQRIDCPVSQIRREVTTSLPSGWWNTPIVNALQDVRVITLGGRTALQCRYGAAGSIQRYAPRGATCTARGNHFVCQTRSAGGGGANPGTFSTGPLTIRQTFTADLDRGVVGNARVADIWFEADTATLLYITPRNGAQIAVGNRRNRGYAGCRRERYSRSRVSLRDVPEGSYVSVRTNEGRISQFRVNDISRGSPKTLKLGYTTWNR